MTDTATVVGYYEKKFADLVGATVVQASATEVDDDWAPMLVLKLKDGTHMAVIAMRDPEGNGAGDFEVCEATVE